MSMHQVGDFARLLIWVGVLAITACGDGTRSVTGSNSELSPQRISAIVSDHVDQRKPQVSRWDVMTRELGVNASGAGLRYPGGDFLGVAVAPKTDSALLCTTRRFFDECAQFIHEGTELVLGWQKRVPEEDPGVVYVINHRRTEDAVAHYSGTSITADPRNLRLGITIQEMADIVTDQRLTLQ